MPHEWIIDVLSDLRGCAESYGFRDLAREIDALSLVALAEITSRNEGTIVDFPSQGALHRRGARKPRLS